MTPADAPTTSEGTLGIALPAVGSDPLDVVSAFAEWAAASSRVLYSYQEEAALALAEGLHVVQATPTGSGKSMVATCGIALARNRGERAVWTAPIKALVSEKFFDLVELFGPGEVGLATGDASINTMAPIIVCTAEILANQALAYGDGESPFGRGFGFACLDEFHYYGESDRGWAWQVPLLELHSTQFLLMSATLGDMTAISEDLRARTGRDVQRITAVTRPTPLYPQWRMTPLADSLLEAVEKGLTPCYVVHSSQAEAIEEAQALTSLPLTTRPQREAIADALKGVKFAAGFGQTLARYLRNGIGVHHAGMLPRYRRLVERLAGEGMLPVICGTDTLGVGINIPIRTVVLRALTKYDGHRVRTLRAREFHQLSGRAGRPGFDPDGHVWAQAPEHVIANERALARAGDDPKARRKVKRVEAPSGFVHYDEKTFNRLLGSPPEPLQSRFRVTPDLVANVLRRPDGVAALKHLLATNHDTDERKRAHRRQAIATYRSLEAAGVAERLRDPDGRCAGVRVGTLVDESSDRDALRFASPLAPFAIEVVVSLDQEELSYPLDVVSVIESILDDPMAILIAQEKAAKGIAIAAMKAEGIEYEERMDRLSGITWPKPLDEVLTACMTTYLQAHPWVHDRPSPKSIVREILETGETFAGFVKRYRIERSEGLLLRYLSEAWRALDRSLPNDAYTDALEDIVEWLGAMVHATDSSLLSEWERLINVSGQERTEAEAALDAPVIGPPRAWRTAMRTAAFGWVELLARRAYVQFAERTGWTLLRVSESLLAYWSEYGSIAIDADARSGAHFELVEEPGRWVIRQKLVDPEGDLDWGLVAHVDLARAMEEGAPTLELDAIGPFGREVTADG